MPEQSQPHSVQDDLDELFNALRYAQGYDVAGWEAHMRDDEVAFRFEFAARRIQERAQDLEEQLETARREAERAEEYALDRDQVAQQFEEQFEALDTAVRRVLDEGMSARSMRFVLMDALGDTYPATKPKEDA